jgi:hypothetical protein
MAEKAPPKVRHQIILESQPRTEAENAKLKPVLKALLRRYGFRCVSAVKLQDPENKKASV